MKIGPVKRAARVALEVGIIDGLDTTLTAVAARSAARSRFLTRRWFAAVAPEAARTMTARRHGVPLLALPIARGRLGIAVVPGLYWPFRSFPIAEGCSDNDLAAFLRASETRRELGRVWRMGPVPADDPAVVALRRVARRGGWTLLERRLATGFVLDLAVMQAAEGGWPCADTLRKNQFHEKHLASHGALEWRFMQGAALTAPIFGDLATVERASRVGERAAANANFDDPVRRAAWERLAKEGGDVAAGRLSAAILYVGGRPAAFSFDMDVDRVRYAIASSQDPAFARHSPNKCLFYRNMAAAMADGICRVEWGAGDGRYERSVGATAGAEIVDLLMVRGRLLRAATVGLGILWQHTTGRI